MTPRNQALVSSRISIKQHGYVLVIILVILIMGSLYSIVSHLSGVTNDTIRAAETQQALKQAKEALIAYAITYRDTHNTDVFGYLPCPDVDGDGSSDALDSQCGANTKVVVGLLPYRTLGLPDLRDANGQCLWYAVSGNYKRNASKYVPMNWDSRGQFKVLDQDGSTVLLDPTSAGDGGAAAVIFAVGPPLSTQTARTSSSSTSCGIASKTIWSAYLESVTLDSDGYSTSSPLTVTLGAIASESNNDLIATISPKEIWDRFRKRSDKGSIDSLSTAIKNALENKLISDFASATTTSPAPTTLPVNPAAYTAPANSYSGYVGEVPDVSASIASSLTTYFSNWKEQYRYAVCKNICAYCLNVGGQQCNGAVFFGGTDTTGNPRMAGARSIADLFEDGDGKPLLLSTSDTFNGAASYAGGSADVGICVAPKTSISAQYFTSACNSGNASTVSGRTSRVAATIDSSTGTITLGYSGAGGGLGDSASGCIWTTSTFPLGSGIRAYFKVNMVTNASGISFAIIDADQQSSSAPCGSEGNYLGYGGTSAFSGTTPIKPPKIGLALDTSASSAGFNDPSYQSASLVYWGSTSSYDDDNTHNVSGSFYGSSGSFPSNRPYTDTPYGVSGDLSSLFSAGAFHVRMDLTRTNCGSTTCDYAANVWMLKDSGASTAAISALRDITVAYSGSLSATVKDAFTMNRYYSSQELLKNVRFGFTSGQASGSQQIFISNLVAHVLP